ncbi:MAG: 3,4-dihydroxy-2-butanone-4-phosphate synthase [Alphaproteobacteria bacterium]|nr:3,4-dihydroxy-2-butanone-4-phosphate synthase [Alphaproteobacteria bacterium]
MTTDWRQALSQPEDIIQAAQRGEMFILADDEDRENEGDIVIAAQFATPAVINFMAKHARGLVCLALEKNQAETLGLSPMAQHNSSRLQTAFTVSIEAREGVTTGISAADRAHTIQTAIRPHASAHDIATPGHVFPLVAREGGVLVRAGHTEAAVDIARLSGHHPSAVICEIMNDDGSMARLPDLVAFAQKHHLKLGTIADLIAYRRRTETIVERKLSRPFQSVHGGHYQLHLYVNKVSYAEHVALVKGDISAVDAPLVRMHALNVLEDVLGDATKGRGGLLQLAMKQIEAAGTGVVVVLREPTPTSLSHRLQLADEGKIPPSPELRDYGVGAQILLDLGIKKMTLLTSQPKTVVGLDAYGLEIIEHKTLGQP